ncbi:MAG: hypothetical protein IOD15_10190 [Phycisphaerales bacterium]|nr:hypothetical protein [Phycisphaerales bacterium]
MSHEPTTPPSAPLLEELTRWEVTGYTTFVKTNPTGRWVAYDDYQRMLDKVRAFVADQSAEIRDALVQGEKQRKRLRDEILRLGWKIGVPQDHKPVLEAADLTLEGLVGAVGRWVDGVIEARRDKAMEVAWTEALAPELLDEVERLLKHDGGPGSTCYHAGQILEAREQMVRIVGLLREQGVGVAEEAEGDKAEGGGA